jgi:hypothetical protein
MTLVWFGFMVLNTTFNNNSVISWWSVLLVGETREPRKKSLTNFLLHNAVHLALIGIQTHNISGDRY